MTRQFLVPSCFFEDDWTNRAFDEMEKILSSSKAGFPLFNSLIDEKTGDMVIEIALAGYDPETVSLKTEDSSIIIEGQTQKPREGFKAINQDIKQSSFRKRFPISTKFNLAKLEAEFKNGILSIKIPVSEERKPKTISIKY